MRDAIPYVNPTMILKFFNEHPMRYLESVNPKPKVGEEIVIPLISLVDYFVTIPEKFRSQGAYVMEYHNALLRMTQKLVNEGLLTKVGDRTGLEQQFIGNGISHPQYFDYGYYDFLILGFPAIRDNFRESVRPILINQRQPDKDENIGTGFVIAHEQKFYLITARHCLPLDSLISFIPFLPNESVTPLNVYVPKDNNIDLAVLEFPEWTLLSPKWFFIDTPYLLDEVLTMGYPPIQGFTEAVQVSETATIASSLKSSIGEITGVGQHYWGGLKDHFLISARVKGGNSGGPVINKYGLVVGIIIELLQDGPNPDLLGYGVAISASVLTDLLNSITGKDSKVEFVNYAITDKDNGFFLSFRQ